MTLNAVSNPAYVSIQAFQGPADSSHITAIDYVSNPTLTSAVVSVYVAQIPALTSSISVAIATIFANLTSPVFMAVYDDTTPGQTFSVGPTSGAGMVTVSAGGFWAFTCGSTLPPTLYLGNANATVGVVNIAVMSN